VSTDLTRVADALAIGVEHGKAPASRYFGTVRAVNRDGTVTVESGLGTRTSVRACRSYSPREEGDVVLVEATSVGPVVKDVLGPPADMTTTALTVSDNAAPDGQGWDQIVTGQLWAKAGAIWAKRIVAAPPPTGGAVTLNATALVTYRGGGLTQLDKAEQGDYTGAGLQTGLATFPSWGALAGKTATGGTLTIHRRAGGHGFTYGEVIATGFGCVASGVPGSPPALIGAHPILIPAALNETRHGVVPAALAQMFVAGTATAIAFYSNSASDNIEIDGVTLAITY
jgi:hypothetical protein